MIELFFDVGSPYAYLAVERFEPVAGVRPVLRPVLLGGIFKATGRSTWGRGEERAARMDDISARALALGVIGVPTTRVGDELYWGDDRLEEIAKLI